MDLQLVNVNNTWDIAVVDGLPVTTDGDNEWIQRAMLAALLQKKTIPMLPTLGNDWTDYTTGKISLPEIDTQIRLAINTLLGRYDYIPYYNIDGEKITFSIQQIQLPGVK